VPRTSASIYSANVRANAARPKYSYAPDVSQEFRERVEQYTTGALRDLENQVSRNALGDAEALPFASGREGEIITVVVPLTMARGDTLAELILLLASQLPSCVLRQGEV
jgi:hypothetical protein